MAIRELTLEEQLERFVERWHDYWSTEMAGSQSFLRSLLDCYGRLDYKPGEIFEQHPFVRAEPSQPVLKGLEAPGNEGPKVSSERADMYIPDVCVWEMKGPKEDLRKHYEQVRRYWESWRPRYMVLSNFHEIWIYDTDLTPDKSPDGRDGLTTPYKLQLSDLPQHPEALGFLSGGSAHFAKRGERVTREASAYIGATVNKLIETSKDAERDRERIVKFALECVFAMYAEDAKLIQGKLFTRALEQAQKSGDLAPVYTLFDDFGRAEEYDRHNPAAPYINGPLFDQKHPKLPLHKALLANLYTAAADYDWSYVRPEVFGGIFEIALNRQERHELGAHYTHEEDILKVVGPTIVRPWQERIDACVTHKDCEALIERMKRFHILDPACGSGNFLYIAFDQMKRLERALMDRWESHWRNKVAKRRSENRAAPPGPYFTLSQLHGIDKDELAVQLSRVVLWIGQYEAARKAGSAEAPFPLRDLSGTIIKGDALFMNWRELVGRAAAVGTGPRACAPEAGQAQGPAATEEGSISATVGTCPRACAEFDDAQTGALAPTGEAFELAIIGNPPFMGRHKMRLALGDEYVDRLHKRFPHNRNADLVTYWYPQAIAALRPGERAGFVSSNSIAQNESREASLDRILAAGGTLHDCWKSYPWPGEAAVHVSIVNWVMGKYEGARVLDGERVESISSGLSWSAELSGVIRLQDNLGICFEGVQPGNNGFIISKEVQSSIMLAEPKCGEVIKPLLIAADVARNVNQEPSRFAIDFDMLDISSANAYVKAFQHIQDTVYPIRTRPEERKTSSAKQKWWQFKCPAPNMRAAISGMSHYLAIPRVSPHLLVARVSVSVLPDSRLKVIALDSWYHFAVLQSAIHEHWAWARGATLEDRLSYTNTTVFETFPFPLIQGSAGVPPASGRRRDAAATEDEYDPRIVPKSKEANALAKAGQAFYEKRAAACIAMNLGLTKVHNYIKGKAQLGSLSEPHQALMQELIRLYEAMNAALCVCYGWPEEAWRNEAEVLTRLLELNEEISEH